MTRFTLERPLRTAGWSRSNILLDVLNHHYGGASWFPAGYTINGDAYVVNPAIQDDMTLGSAGLLGQHPDYSWSVTETVWLTLSWNPRIVYETVENHQVNMTTYSSAFVRREVSFTTHTKPSWQNILDWADDLGMEIWTNRQPERIDQFLAQSRAAHVPAPARTDTWQTDALDIAVNTIAAQHRGWEEIIKNPLATRTDRLEAYNNIFRESEATALDTRLLTETNAAAIQAPVLTKELRRECRRRIVSAYGAETWEEELEIRLRNDQTAAQDTDRERLRQVYQAEVARVATMTEEQRKAFDPGADTIWAST